MFSRSYPRTAGFSDIELTNMGILANVATFIGIEQLLPEKKYKNMSLMVGSFLVCGIAICLLALNSSTAIAFAVLVVINLMSRPIEDYQILELTKITDDYGYDAKTVQENFYAVSDGINVLQAPIIGAMCGVSMIFCYVALGAITALVPGGLCNIFRNYKIKTSESIAIGFILDYVKHLGFSAIIGHTPALSYFTFYFQCASQNHVSALLFNKFLAPMVSIKQLHCHRLILSEFAFSTFPQAFSLSYQK